MNLRKMTGMRWTIRSLGATLLALTIFAGAGSAFADDDDIVTYGPNACTTVAGMPAYPGATCVKNKRDIDNGVTQNENHYVAQAAADTGDAVRLYYETTFQQQGWTIVKAKRDIADQEWTYTVVKGQRRVKVEVEGLEPGEVGGTEIVVEEK